MKRAAPALALVCLLATLLACAKRTVEGRWHLDRDHTTMPMGFNLKGESYLEIKLTADGVDLRDSISNFETGDAPLLERHYPFGKELKAEDSGNSELYTSARLAGPTLYTQERVVHFLDRGKKEEYTTNVTYVVSSNGMHLVGTDENGKIATYDRQ
ncbi:MAG: hypothetical protein HYX28_08290 [Candidatus Koribacter versatilis]|uniref:Lipoprotein n=1 Tax=Candidatus Korobacter versatilis TaxID=658062 RepID=A0A932A9Z0_9BACT|nr:hypothetical protein [Candidatus Koribacter versatilis]